MNRTSRLLLAVVCATLAPLVLSACGNGSSGGDLSDEQKIQKMEDAHKNGPSSGVNPGTAAPGAKP